MTVLQRIAWTGATAGVAFGLAFAAAADDAGRSTHGSLTINTRGHAVLQGKVSKVDLAAKSFGVKVWGVEWTVKVTDDTKLAPKGRGALSLADLAVDHVVHVNGTVDAATPLVVSARKVVDRSASARPKGAAYTGTVSALTPPDAFTLQLERGGQLTVKTTAATKITEGDATKAYADIAVGTPVAVKGTYDAATNTLTAEKVVLRPTDADGDRSDRSGERRSPRARGPRGSD